MTIRYCDMTDEQKDHVRLIRRRHVLKKCYGMTVEQYDTMLEAQGGRCAICGTDEPGGKTNPRDNKPQFNVDHDHETGVNRGLLCNNCNLGIGKLQESVFILESAIDYLRRAEL